MSNINENKVKNYIVVEGVKLSPECIKALQHIQEDNNVYDIMMENISIVAMYIADFDPDPKQNAEQLEMIKKLSFIRSYIKDLKEP